MKKNLLLFFCIFSFSVLFGQNSRYNFGNVPVSQLEMTTYANDSSANAVILHDYGEIKVMDANAGYRQIFNRCRRIKILKKGGLDYGDLRVFYYSYKNKERITDIKAVVTLPSGEKFSIPKKDFFTEKESKYWSSKRIAIPKLEVGAVIDYYYNIESEYIVRLKEWDFQSDIPTQISKLTIDFDEKLSYLYLFQGFAGMDKTKEGENTIMQDSLSKAVIEPKKFTVTNVPALKTEPYITTLDDYGLRIRFQCTQYLTRYGEIKEMLSDWETINKNTLDNLSFGAQYKKKTNCGKILKGAASLIEKEMPQLDKAKALYNYINENIESNWVSSIYVQTSLNEAFEKKSASKSEINLMLLALLQEAEIEAYPILISTRDNGYPMPKYPIMDQFNRTLIYVIIEGKEYFVESGNALRPFGELSRNSMNREGFLLKKGGGKWLKIIPSKSKKIFISDFTLDEKGKMTGKISANYTKTAASNSRWTWLNEEEEKTWVQELENGILDFELDSVSVENKEEISKPFKIHFNGDFSGAAQEVGNFMYINPFIFSDYSENPFKSETRQYPVDFPYPFSNQFIINIKYDAENYEIEELPKDAQLALPEKMVTVRYAAQEKAAGWIQITYKLSVDKPYFPVNFYSGLRTLFDITAEKLGEQIVLKKL